MTTNKNSEAKTVRFWTFENDDWVRLSLAPGQSVRWSTGGPDEEGWSARGSVWFHAGDRIVRRWWSDGCDCDGRLQRGGSDQAALTELAAEPAYRNPVFRGRAIYRPEWVEIDREQRDFYAEAAGY